MNGYDMICEAASKARTTRMPEAASVPGTAVRPRDTSVPRPEFDNSPGQRMRMAAAMDNLSPEEFEKLIPGTYYEASGSARSDGKSSQDRDGGNRYDTSTPERRKKALAAARRSDNPEDLKKLRGKVAESALLKPMRPREAVSSGDMPEMEEAPLNAKRRNALPGKDFAGKDRSYPIDTPARARSALSRAAANASPAEQARIRAAVKRKYPDMDVTGGSKKKK